MQKIDRFLRLMNDHGASDFHLTCEEIRRSRRDSLPVAVSAHRNSENQNANAEWRKTGAGRHEQCSNPASLIFYILHSHSNFLSFRRSTELGVGVPAAQDDERGVRA